MRREVSSGMRNECISQKIVTLKKKVLIAKTETVVRFSDVDSLRIVWHGNYVKYFEDGREEFGKKYNISYMDVLGKGYITPVVQMKCDFKKPLEYGETAIIETRFVDCEAAKLKFEYTIYRSSNTEIVATGETVQVFLDTKGELMLVSPPFFMEWKKKWGVL